MSEAIFKPDLAIAELQGSIRAPEFEWILLDAKAAISAVVEKGHQGGIPAPQLRRIISVCQRVNAAIGPGTNVVDARNTLRLEIGLQTTAANGDAADILPKDWRPKIPRAFRTVDE
jgi:hypothetical protein